MGSPTPGFLSHGKLWPQCPWEHLLTLVNAIDEEVQGRVGLPCEADVVTFLLGAEKQLSLELNPSWPPTTAQDGSCQTHLCWCQILLEDKFWRPVCHMRT